MITIAISDGNKTFCQGLKTMLEQVEDFRVMVVPLSCLTSVISEHPFIDVLMVDEDIFLTCTREIRAAENLLPSMKTIILTMDREIPGYLPEGMEMIHKGSGKGEFASRIKKVAFLDSKSNIP